MSELRYAYDLYPRDDPRDGARILRFSDLTEGEWVAEANGTGSGVIILPGDSPDAGSIDPRGLQYVRVVEIDPDDPDGATLSGFAERVVHGFFLDTGSFDALTEQNTKRLTFGGAGTLSYWARAVMAPHTYIHDVFTGQDPFDRTWRLDQQSTVYANGNYTGAMLWRVLYELSHFRSGATYTHKHADGIIYIDAHDDDRTESAVPDAVIDFTAFLDSNGNAWTEKVGEFRVSVLDNGLSVIRLLMELGAYVEMDPDTFETRAYQASSHRRDRTGAAWGSSVIRFQSPTDGTLDTGNILSDAKRALTAHIQRSTMWAGGGDDTYAKATGTFDIPWEGGLNSDANDLDALEVQADRQITARSDAGDTLRVRTVPIDDPTGGFYRPLHSTGVLLDDLATVHNGSGQWDFDEQTFPVAAVGGKLREGGDWDTFVDLGASFRPMEGRQFQVAALGSHTHPPNPRLCRDSESGCLETFTRTVASGGWGTSEFGPPWIGADVGLSVNGTHGVYDATTSLTSKATVAVPYTVPVDVTFRIGFQAEILNSWDAYFGDGSISAGAAALSNGDGTWDCTAYAGDGAGQTDSTIFVVSALHTADFFVRLRVDSSDDTVRAKVWLVTDPEPGAWQGEATRSGVGGVTGPLTIWPTHNAARPAILIDSITFSEGCTATSSCIHGGPAATSGDASVACGKCVAAGNHEHDYVAAGGTTGQVLKKASATDWDTEWAADATGAPATADYLVGTAQAGLSAEIVVGTTPGGELGGTWAAPTVDATHSGSTHSAATDTHIADTADAHDASAVSFVPTGTIAATNVQGAIEEVAAEAGSGNGAMGPPGPPGDDGEPGPQGPPGSAGMDGATGPAGSVGFAPPGTLFSDVITGDGVTGTFALTHTPSNSWALVSTNGADLLPSEYAIVAGDIVFDVAPVNLSEVLVTYVYGTAAAGPMGPPGFDGTDGEQGPPGPQGDPGAVGAIGLTGPEGPQGLPGMDGADGSDGADGASGTPGAPGAIGPTGPMGPMGPAGIDGEDGAEGPLAAAHSHSGASTLYAPGSFTVATGNYAIMVELLALTSSQAATLEGTSVLRIT